MKNLFNVSNEIVVITGGAGRLGLEYIKTFLDQNSTVIALDIKKNDQIKKFEVEYPLKFLYLNCNITFKSSILSASEIITNKMGFPTVLINNAAIDSPPDSESDETGPFENYPEESWDKILNVNLKGVFNCCQIFGSIMSKKKKGSIINISSIYGIVSPDQSIYDYKRKNGELFFKPIAYSVSKSGLINMTKYLAVYWSKKNIRVNTLIISGVLSNQDSEFIDAYCKRIPIGRMANKDEYNAALIYLASNASSYMTGSELTIDGGWTAI